jgi:hypothetical protein
MSGLQTVALRDPQVRLVAVEKLIPYARNSRTPSAIEGYGRKDHRTTIKGLRQRISTANDGYETIVRIVCTEGLWYVHPKIEVQREPVRSDHRAGTRCSRAGLELRCGVAQPEGIHNQFFTSPWPDGSHQRSSRYHE